MPFGALAGRPVSYDADLKTLKKNLRFGPLGFSLARGSKDSGSHVQRLS